MLGIEIKDLNFKFTKDLKRKEMKILVLFRGELKLIEKITLHPIEFERKKAIIQICKKLNTEVLNFQHIGHLFYELDWRIWKWDSKKWWKDYVSFFLKTTINNKFSKPKTFKKQDWYISSKNLDSPVQSNSNTKTKPNKDFLYDKDPEVLNFLLSERLKGKEIFLYDLKTHNFLENILVENYFQNMVSNSGNRNKFDLKYFVNLNFFWEEAFSSYFFHKILIQKIFKLCSQFKLQLNLDENLHKILPYLNYIGKDVFLEYSDVFCKSKSFPLILWHFNSSFIKKDFFKIKRLIGLRRELLNSETIGKYSNTWELYKKFNNLESYFNWYSEGITSEMKFVKFFEKELKINDLKDRLKIREFLKEIFQNNFQNFYFNYEESLFKFLKLAINSKYKKRFENIAIHINFPLRKETIKEIIDLNYSQEFKFSFKVPPKITNFLLRKYKDDKEIQFIRKAHFEFEGDEETIKLLRDLRSDTDLILRNILDIEFTPDLIFKYKELFSNSLNRNSKGEVFNFQQFISSDSIKLKDLLSIKEYHSLILALSYKSLNKKQEWSFKSKHNIIYLSEILFTKRDYRLLMRKDNEDYLKSVFLESWQNLNIPFEEKIKSIPTFGKSKFLLKKLKKPIKHIIYLSNFLILKD